MQVEQKNIWEDVTRNAKRDNSNRAIAAYQANMPDAGAVAAFGGQEAYVQQKTAVSEAGNIDMATYSNPAKQGQEEKTVAEKIAGQEISSGQARSNEIAVVANTTSTEDLKKMEEDGFSISDADSHTIITVTDKIKAALAKAGVDVSSMGGTLTKEQLEEITGSPVVTQQIMDSLAANDLPATEENVQDSAEDTDDLLPDAIELVVRSGQASVSMLQRRFRIGYNRAARIVDMMEARGIVGPQDGSRPRQVLLTEEEFENMGKETEEQET